MPITPVSYSPRPYVSGTSIGELMRLRGDHAASAELRRGDIQAQMWANLGQQLAGGIQNYAQQKQDAPLRAAQVADVQARADQRQQATDEKAQLSRQDTAFMSLLEQQPNPDPREVMSIYGPQRGIQIAQGLTAFGELQSGAVKDARENAGRLAIALKSLSPSLQARLWPAVRTASIKGGLGDEETIPADLTPEFLDGVIGWSTGKEPAAAPALIQRDPTRDLVDPQTGRVVTAGTPAAPDPNTLADNVRADEMLRLAQRRDQRDAASAGQGSVDPGPLETIIGPDGKAIRVARRDAIGKPPAAGTEKASSGVQKRVLNFFNRAEQADKDLEALEPAIRKLSLAGQTWQEWAPNFAQTQLGQSYTAAQRQFTEARLRKDSGAAVPQHEYDKDELAYFVKPGDTNKTIQDKNRARAAILSALAFESGQALGEFVGDADEARKIVEGYKARSARPAGSGVMVNMKAPDGTVKSVSAEEVEHYKGLGATVVGR